MAKKVIIEDVELGNSGEVSKDKINHNFKLLDKVVDSLDGETVKTKNITNTLGFAPDKVPSEFAVSKEAQRLQKESDNNKEDLQNLEKKVDNIESFNKGYFSTEARLNSTHPNPEDGWYAYIGVTNTIFEATGGIWNNTRIPIPEDLTDLSDYAPKVDESGNKVVYAPDGELDLDYTPTGGSEKTAKELDDDIALINNTLYGNNAEEITLKWQMGYIKTDGTENSVSGTYRKTDFIAIDPSFKYTTFLGGSDGVYLVSFYTSTNMSSIISSGAITGTANYDGSDYTFTPPATAKYIRLTTHQDALASSFLRKIIGGGSEGLVSEVEKLIPFADDVKEMHDILVGVGNLTKLLKPFTSGHINTSGQLITASTYVVSAFVPVEEGKKYKTISNGSAGVFVISGYSSNAQSSFVTSTMNVLGNTTLKEVIVTIPIGVNYVRVCLHPSSSLPVDDVYLEEVDRDKGLVERVGLLEENGTNNNKADFRMKRCAVFSLMTDDATSTDKLALSLANEYGIPLSFAIQTSKIGINGVDFYKNAYKNGSSVLSHTSNHIATESEIINSKKVLKDYGFPTNGYVSPGGGTNASLFPIVDRYYGYANSLLNTFLTTDNFDGLIPKFDQNVDPYRLTRIGLEGSNTNIKDCSRIFAFIDFAIEHKLFVIMYTHEVPSTYKNNDGTSVLTVDNLKSIFEYLKNKQDNYYCKVLSTDEAVREYYNYKDF